MTIRSALIAALGAISIVVVGCDPVFEPANARAFRADLEGGNVRPTASASNATGTLTLTLGDTSITYLLTVSRLTDVTLAHLHSGGTETPGPIVVAIINAQNAPAGTIVGTLASGTITAANIGPQLPISFGSLVSLLRNGDMYVDVHTAANVGGEIRGQIVPTH